MLSNYRQRLVHTHLKHTSSPAAARCFAHLVFPTSQTYTYTNKTKQCPTKAPESVTAAFYAKLRKAKTVKRKRQERYNRLK